MAAPRERASVAEPRPSARRRVLIARQLRSIEDRRRRGTRWGASALLLLPLAALPIVAILTALLAAARFYDDTVAHMQTPTNMIAAVANYGGAQVFDRNGTLLYRFPEQDGGLRLPTRLDQVSRAMIDATVSTEDVNFWQREGFDPRGILLAAYENMRSTGNPLSGRGGSGITQQLVKQTLIPPEDRTSQSVMRKIEEVIYARQVASSFTHEQILEWYLNITNYGGPYNGVETAAQGYFGVSAKDLTLAQAAMLAGIPQSPAMHSPYINPAGARARQAEVQDLMVAHDFITQAEADAAKREDVRIQTREDALPLRAPWFVEYVRRELVARFGAECVARCGLSVTTTLDLTLQEQAQATLDKNLTTYGDPTGAHNGAVVSIDARTGEILVMVGSRNYNDARPEIQGSNNFATAILQPGSSFKPFVYLSLFMKKGYGPSSIIFDEPFVTSDGYKCENPGIPPRNYGPVPVKVALGSSLNCPANRAAEVVGVPDILDIARTMGVNPLGDASQYGPSIATGGANITLLDLAYGYTTLARSGSMVGAPGVGTRPLDPIALRRVTDATGRTLYDFAPQEQQVVRPEYTYLVSSILSDCQNRRLIWDCSFPHFRLSDGRPVAGKTGTQQGTDLKQSNANWLFLYTPNLVTGGWVGNANRAGWTDRNGAANAVGYTVQAVEDAVIQAYGIPSAPFTRPPDIVESEVRVPDGTRTGTTIATAVGCGPTEKGLFVRGTAPDVNNRVCVNGRLTIPAEQLGSGGLKAYPQITPTPTPTATAGSAIGTFLSPSPGASVSGGVLVLATGPTGQRVDVQWGSGASPSAWRSLGAGAIGAGQFYAAWNTAGLPPGPYALRLTVNGAPFAQMLVEVRGSGGALPTPAPRTAPTAAATPAALTSEPAEGAASEAATPAATPVATSAGAEVTAVPTATP